MGRPAALACEAIDLAETQTRALADRLGGEEGFEDAGNDVGRHARAVVRHRHADIVAGGEVRDLARSHGTGTGLNRDTALVADRVAGVDHEVEQGRLELGGVNVDPCAAALQLEFELHRLADGAAQQGLALADLGVEIHRLGAQRLPAREGQQLVSQAFAPTRSRQGGFTEFLTLRRIVG